jgi:hypothetical protein
VTGKERPEMGMKNVVSVLSDARCDARREAYCVTPVLVSRKRDFVPASASVLASARIVMAVLIVLLASAGTSQAQQSTTTALKASGTQGDYSLTATVDGSKGGASAGPTGSVKFVDATEGNTVLVTETLGAKSVGSLSWTVSSTLTFNAGTSSAITNLGAISANDLNGDGFTDLAFNGLTLA